MNNLTRLQENRILQSIINQKKSYKISDFKSADQFRNALEEEGINIGDYISNIDEKIRENLARIAKVDVEDWDAIITYFEEKATLKQLIANFGGFFGI